MRIFLSYGHDSNEELVRRIKADLEKRGHDVWFDKNPEKEKGIRPGDDWRRAITDGIVGSHRVLSFLSKHSTRDPGVCLDEIAIAIGVKGGNIQTILSLAFQLATRLPEYRRETGRRRSGSALLSGWRCQHAKPQLTPKTEPLRESEPLPCYAH